MKKNVFTLFFMMMFVLSSYAQNSEHLKFKGVPIDGTLNEYVAKMKQAGFQLVETEDGVALLEGEFAGYSDCMVAVKTLQKQNLVHEIAVLFPSQDKWSGLSYDYERLKAMLSQKYGEPSECVEEFHNIKNKSKEEINILMKDNVVFLCNIGNHTWYSSFETPSGRINLSIEKEGFTCFVILRYSDKINSEKFDDAAMEDL